MIGERVRHARDFCNLTQTELAELSGLHQGKVSEIEAGRNSQPKEDEVARVARATGFPVAFFYEGPLPDLPEGNFRRLKRGKARATRQVRAQARQVVELVQRAETQVTMPPVRLRPIREAPTADAIEALAASVREAAGVGTRDPLPNLTRALERAGVVVAGLPHEIPDHYGYSAWPDFGLDGRPIVLFAFDAPGDRQRFTLAHELGHLLLHSPLRDDELEAEEAEAEANRFAGALLLPKKAAMEAMRPPLTLTTLAHVKATYGASIGMCAQRARDLDLINEARFVSFRKQLTSRGWHRQEPVDVPQEKPVLIRKILEHMGKGNSVSERAESARLPTFAYRALAQAN